VLEALACGVPVAGFKTGGITDAVSEGVNGFVVPEQSTEALRAVLGHALADRTRLSHMAVVCRESVVDSYSIGATAARFLELCQSL
jgi:glycosyltransferase involved in cell wall biosynthesis